MVRRWKLKLNDLAYFIFMPFLFSLQGDGGGDEDLVARLFGIVASQPRRDAVQSQLKIDSIIASVKEDEVENGEVVLKEEGEDKDLGEEE